MGRFFYALKLLRYRNVQGCKQIRGKEVPACGLIRPQPGPYAASTRRSFGCSRVKDLSTAHKPPGNLQPVPDTKKPLHNLVVKRPVLKKYVI